MKILIANERFIFRYGADRALLILGQNWATAGHEVKFLGCRFDQASVDRISACAVKMELDEGEMNESAKRWLEANWDRVYPSGPPDVIFFACWPFFKSIPFFKSTGATVIFFDCGAVPIEGQPLGLKESLRNLRDLRRRFLIKCDGIISISEFIKRTQSLPDSEGIPYCSSVLLGADHLKSAIWKFDGTLKDQDTQIAGEILKRVSDTGEKMIFSLGRWEGGYKNSAEVIDFVRKLKDLDKRFFVVCLGSKPDFDIEEPILSHLEFLGHPDDETMARVMKKAHLGVCFSRWEGFNLPLAEMQSIGLPTLVYNLAAHPEVVASNEVLCENLAQMVHKAESILSDRWMSSSEWEHLCENFRQKFTWEKTAKTVLNEIRNVISSKNSSDKDPNTNWKNRKIIIDVTNAVKDTANTGVMRVTRKFCRTLQAICDPIFVLWSPVFSDYVYPKIDELNILGAFGGPSYPSSEHISNNEHTRIDWIGLRNDQFPGWLIITETFDERRGPSARRLARTHGFLMAVVFHDAIPISNPEFCSQSVVENHRNYIIALSHFDLVLPNSDFSAQCLADYWNSRDAGHGNIKTNLLPGEFGGSARVRNPRPRDGNVKILCVSTLEPRKNHGNLIDACLLLRERHPELNWKLTMVGNSYAGRPEIADKVRNLTKSDNDIEWLEVVDDQRLQELYENCSFTVYPSLVEGFGMPIMESLWFGKPCICNRGGVMAELAAGGGCLSVDATDSVALSDAMFRLASDSRLFDELSDAAISREIKSWSAYTVDFLKALESHEQIGLRNQFNRIIYSECFTSGWQMNDSERNAFAALLLRLQPKCAIEIGTYKGGSLSLLSQFCEMVFSVDIDPTIPDKFNCFKNVSFLTGGSHAILPTLFDQLDRAGIPVGLVLVDGDHSEEGVRGDINLILARRPTCPLVVVMHDSWNPICRRGLRAANWASCPHVHFLDLDWVPGRIIENGSSSDGEIWGGLALAYLHPSERTSPLIVSGTSQRMQSIISGDLA